MVSFEFKTIFLLNIWGDIECVCEINLYSVDVSGILEVCQCFNNNTLFHPIITTIEKNIYIYIHKTDNRGAGCPK